MMSLNSYQKRELLKKYDTLNFQYDNMKIAINELKNLFADDNLTIVKSNISREEKEEVYRKLQNLPQKDILIENQQYLDAAEEFISEKEEIKKKENYQAEIARQKAIEKAKQDAIKNLMKKKEYEKLMLN